MLRVLMAIAIAVAVGAAAAGFAASLNLEGGTVGAGDATVPACDADGVSVAYTVAFNAGAGRFEVTHVTVNDIAAPACDGMLVQVALTGATLLGTAEGTAHGGTTGPLAVHPAPAADAVDDAHVAISN